MVRILALKRCDKGYASKDREARLKAEGYRNHIQRKGHRNKPLSRRQHQRNRRIAKTCTRVEHIFGTVAQMGGKLIRTIGQARAKTLYDHDGRLLQPQAAHPSPCGGHADLLTPDMWPEV